MSARGAVGMYVDLDKVPLREKGMTAYEIMLSESQERMLFIIDKEKVEIAANICKKWDVPITQIGEVTTDGLLKVYRDGKQVCQLDAGSLVLGGGAPQYDLPATRPAYLDVVNNVKIDSLDLNIQLDEAFIKILSSPTIASKRWIHEQYDSQVRTNTVNIKGDAAVLRLKELPNKGIAVCTDCNARYAYLDPYKGAMIAVAEAARNVVCAGAEPLAITNCLNFGNPYDPEVYWTFKEAVKGMGDACRALNTPVTGGNVSFHNESRDRAVFPTPTIGMLGLIENLDQICSAGFKNEGDSIYLLGNQRRELGGSEYIKLFYGDVVGKCPDINIEEEKRLQKVLLSVIRMGLINSAHDCSEGGIALCLAENSILTDNNIGAEITLPWELSASALFGESQSRVIVSISQSKERKLEDICRNENVSYFKIGKTQKEKFTINNKISYKVDELRNIYENAILSIMNKI